MRNIWTIGHWTWPEAAFTELLNAQGIELVVDVRAHPGSRSSPQFRRERMPEWLSPAKIEYVHLPELGGRRPRQDVDTHLNAGWKNASFKNYADYSLLPEYEHGIARLDALASQRRVIIMCAEVTPWRCHRTIIANTLTALGWQVLHVIGDAAPRLHLLGQWGAEAAVDDAGRLTYPAH